MVINVNTCVRHDDEAGRHQAEDAARVEHIEGAEENDDGGRRARGEAVVATVRGQRSKDGGRWRANHQFQDTTRTDILRDGGRKLAQLCTTAARVRLDGQTREREQAVRVREGTPASVLQDTLG